MTYEYVVVPAPKKAPKVKGEKTSEGRFARALTEVMNAYGAEGWEYLRSDTLPCEERAGLTGTRTVFQNLLVFRRALVDESYDMPAPETVATPEELAAELAPVPGPAPVSAPAPVAAPKPQVMPRLGSSRDAGHPQAPRLGPASADPGRVTPFPLAGAERFDRGSGD
ncbi:DUF4177 domain-containing protein [Oceaniglobus roseus]|uniref:DUF4177 domain-containing protein n=1 Tax=Oceaniglobus roseus TaxID=1737570 RepID=UPI001C12A075|nr:DUF4177 domain-containing protein [Kandeliimicrobium roseum]